MRFAFLKEIFYGLGEFFQWSFQALPPIGFIANWILTFVGIALLAYWLKQILSFEKEDQSIID